MSHTSHDDAAVHAAGRTLTRLHWGAVAVPLLQAAFGLALLPLVADAGRAALPQAAALLLATAAGFALLAIWGARHAQRIVVAAAQRLQRQRELFDALPLGIVVYDASDRFELCNTSFRRIYAPLSDLLERGRSFAEILRAAVARGLVPEARGREEAWIEERTWAHGQGSTGAMREMPDGRWRRIVEHRLSDGGVLAYSFDVTEIVRRDRSSEAAHQEAESARALLRDAIEALPAAFELFDADDRLLLSNSRLHAMYPRVAHLMTGKPRFEDVVRAHRAAGGLAWVGDDFEGWLRQRLEQRRRPAREPRLHPTDEGRWMRLHEQVTSAGGLVCVRIDVTDWVERGREIERLRTALAHGATDAAAAGRPGGLHLTADLGDCAAGAPMADPDRLRALCLQAVVAAGLHAVAERFHAFPAPGGVTGVVLLAESHLAIHTWPEHAAVTLDVFVCNLGADNGARARQLLAAVEAAFGAARSARHEITRSLAH